jgi:hypothetical protein
MPTSDEKGVKMRRTLVPAMSIIAAGLSVSVAAAQTPTVQPKTQTSTAAQAASNVDVVATYLTDRLKTELNLTPEQIPKVKAIGVKGATELEKLINKYAPDTSAAGDAALVKGMLSTMNTSQRELKTVLTPEQWTQHQANRAQRIALNQTEIMAYTLDLSRQQILDVERINLASAGKMVRALDQPVGAAKRTQTETLNVLQPYIAERDSSLVKVLTQAQWKEMQENRRALREVLAEQANTVATAKP